MKGGGFLDKEGGIYNMFDLTPFDFGFGRNMFRRMQREFDAMNRMFESFEPASMRCDVEDLGDHYELNLELPGMSKDEISLQVHDNVLTVRAEHKSETNNGPEIEAENVDEKSSADKNELKAKEKAELGRPEGRYIHRERSWQRMERSFNVEDIVVEDIRAKYENGLLTITLPKQKPTSPEEDIHTVEID